MRLHRIAVARHGKAARRLVLRLERVLIVVERHLGVDHQLAAAGHIDHRIGPQPPVFGVDALLGDKVRVFRQSAAFQHVLKLLLAPATARFRRIAQGVDEPRGFLLHPVLPLPYLLDGRANPGIGFRAFLLDLADRGFVGRQSLVHRLQQLGDLLAALFIGLVKALVGPLEKLPLRGLQHLRANLGKLRRQRLFRLEQLLHLLLMIARIGLKRRQLGPRRIALVADTVEGDPQRIRRLRGFLGRLNRILRGFAAEKPAQRQPAQKSKDNCDYGDDRVQFGSLSDRNEKRT